MKENIKWVILGVCIIIAAIVYVFGTRYQAIKYKGGFDVDQVFIYDRITGNRK